MLTPTLASSPRARAAVDGWYAVPSSLSWEVPGTASAARQVERLPFTVRVAHTAQDLQKAVDVRHAAYARHLPAAITQGLRSPEPLDRAPGVAVLLAESKVDGSALGTLRIQTNRYQPLALEQSFDLPDWMAGAPCAEVTRLAVAQAVHSRVVKTVMLKAAYFWCLREGVRFVLVAARTPLDRQYARLMFRDIYPGQGFVPLAYAFNLPHRVMYCQIATARDDGAEHPLYDFWFNTDHPDIDLD